MDPSPITMGKSKADQAARQAARENYSTVALAKPQDQTPEPAHESLRRHTLLSCLHSIFHTSTQNLKLFLNSFFLLTPEDSQYLHHLTSTCPTCQRTHPHTPLRPGPFPTPPGQGTHPRGRLADRLY
jgi:hypothetical protein